VSAEPTLESLLGQIIDAEARLGPITAGQYEALDENLARRIEIVDGHAVYCEAPSRPHNRAARRISNMVEQGARKHTAAHGGCLSVDTDVDLRLHDRTLFPRDPGTPTTVSLPVEITLDWSELIDLVGG
jgi:hypothetical protein